MGSVVLNGATSGATTITPTDAVTVTVTLPASGGTLQTSGSGYTTNGVAYATSTSALATGSALQFDGSNLGLGVTPSAWSGAKGFDIGNRTAVYENSGNTASGITNNLYIGSGGYTYKATAAGSALQQLNGTFYWYNTPSGTAGTVATLTQAMTLNNSGALLIGTSTSTAVTITKLQLASAGNTYLQISSGSTGGCFMGSEGIGTVWYNYSGAIGSETTTKSLTIGSSGSIGAPSGTNIYNASDARLKKNIQPLTKGLDAINALKPVSFNWITDFCKEENDKTLYGFVAQDTKEVDENLVEGFNNGGNVIVGDLTVEKAMRVNEKFIIPMLTKAIQELNAIVTAQATEITALKAKVGI